MKDTKMAIIIAAAVVAFLLLLILFFLIRDSRKRKKLRKKQNNARKSSGKQKRSRRRGRQKEGSDELLDHVSKIKVTNMNSEKLITEISPDDAKTPIDIAPEPRDMGTRPLEASTEQPEQKTEPVMRKVEDLDFTGVYVEKVHGIGKRSSQQDSFGLSEAGNRLSTMGKGILAIVADGMGGLSNGDEISIITTASMLQTFENMSESAPGDRRLLKLLNTANDKINAFLKTRPDKKSGSTLISVLIQGNMLFWLSVGDSHIYLYRGETLIQINRDHVYSVELDEKAARGEISQEEANTHAYRKALTSYIGMGRLKEIDRNIRPLKLVKGDRILLMSDGVYNTLSDEEICQAMTLPMEKSAADLQQRIESRNTPDQDNYTALILEFTEP